MNSEAKKNIMWCPVFIIVTMGIIMDIFVSMGKCNIPVTQPYMDSIYSGIVTISVLNFTLIALLSGTLSTCYYGYQLKDILGFKNTPVNLKIFITVSLLHMILATMVLFLNYIIDSVNVLTSLLFSMVYIVWYTGQEIYKIMTNENYCIDIVKNYYETIVVKEKINYNLFKFHLNKLSKALEIAIEEKNKEDKDKVLEMLRTLCAFMKDAENNTEYYDYSIYLKFVLDKHVVDLSLQFGYNEMVKEIINLYEIVSHNQYVRNDFLILPLKEIQFYDDKILQSFNYLDQIIDLSLLDEYKKYKIKDEDIQRILHSYISSLLKNQLCSTTCKNVMITNYISKLSRFNWNCENQLLLVDQVALLNLLHYHIITNEDLNERKFLFKELVKNTFINNVHNSNITYYNYLSIILQVFYAYIMHEVETLKEDYRENLKRLLQTDIATSNIVRLNVRMLIKMNIEGVLCAIALRIEKEDDYTTKFEYFPPYMMAKSVIWTKEFNIRFMFFLFMIYNDEVGYYSLYKRFFKWDKMNNTAKLQILNEFMSLFDYNTEVLKINIIDKIGRLADLMECSFSVNENKQKELFEHIREEHVKLFTENSSNVEMSELNLEDIRYQLNELMKLENVFGWSEDYYNEFYVKYSTPYCICRKEHMNNKSAARNIQIACLSAINNFISSSTNELELSFDEQGIKKMLNFLNNSKYDSKNYTFTDDWAFSKELRESLDFKEIINKNSFIDDVSTHKINSRIYFNRDNFKFNIKISYYKWIDLTDKECVEYIENSKTYNGLYNIDGALMAKDKAINTVQRLFCKERIVFKLMVSFKRNDVTHIKFKTRE
ncbi:hypothetical protein [Geosporobacter ferrireducens]|uniref:Uncharacterized protein n=1 Tax=Geosporobacter ferrireducens TaxID=1424294 RepID=A0A1D8GBM6_9FIRM|nr:hypothetical protein [Geosporobacter ferrireducens]AOT68308.1 hypothetical protein Gferi_01110 [Geosporobacter ferrireducens]